MVTKRVAILGGPLDGQIYVVEDHITKVHIRWETNQFIRSYTMPIEYAPHIGLVARWKELEYVSISEITE